MTTLQINRTELLEAFASADPDIDKLLDRTTGAIHYLSSDVFLQLEDLLDEAEEIEGLAAILTLIEAQVDLTPAEREELRIAAHLEGDVIPRYLPIPTDETRTSYQDRVDFIATVTHEFAQVRLADALHGKRAFRRFKDVLYAYPEIQTAWFAFQAEQLEIRVRRWLAEVDLEAELV